jgi:hypothetical protein
LTDNTMTSGEWVTICLAVLGLLGVYAPTNTPVEHRRRVGQSYHRP